MSKAKLTVLSGDSDIVARMARLKSMLSEIGYRVFDVVSEKRLTDLDIVIIHSSAKDDVFWIYPTKKGWLVTRPFVRSFGSQRVRLGLNRLGEKTAVQLKLTRSRPMPSGSRWFEWIPPENRREAAILRLPV